MFKPDQLPVVGRDAEIESFKEALEHAGARGTTILVTGPVGMGKSALLREFAAVAEQHDTLRCTCPPPYQVGESDDPESFLERLLFETFRLTRGSDGRPRIAGPNWRKQVSAFFGLINAHKLVEALLSKPGRPMWSDVLALFKRLSENMPAERRIVFLIDPEKYMRKDSGGAWLPILAQLPPKFMLVFAQRPDGVLAGHPDLVGGHVRTLPETGLSALPDAAAREMMRFGLEGMDIDKRAAMQALAKYEGWPVAIAEALWLLSFGTSPDDLPTDPNALSEQILKKCEGHPLGGQALEVFRVLAVLDVPAPLPVISGVLGQQSTTVRQIVGTPPAVGLVVPRDESYTLFHGLFADAVRTRIKRDEQWQELHERATRLLEDRLKDRPRDEFALSRLAFHVLEARGRAAFVDAVIEQFPIKYALGILTGLERELRDTLSHAGSSQRAAATISGNLGAVLQTRGDLDGAEAMYRRALQIEEELGRKEGMANNCGNLGIVLRTRGDLDGAEAMHRRALQIEEELGRKEGMASEYGSLGNVLQIRGDLNGAEAMHRRALEINEELGRKEGMASNYCSLGIMLRTRGDLDGAEAMHRRALEINEELGRKAGMATNYGHLGIVFQHRGDLDEAEAMHRRSLEIEEELGRKEGMASDYGNLGVVLQTRGDLDGAEAMYRRALQIEEELGRKEGMANNYGNLGNVLQMRGDLDGAEAMHRRSLQIEEELGRKEGMASDYGNLGNVLKIRGDLDGAEAMWRKSLTLFKELGSPEANQIQARLRNLRATE